MGNDLGACKLLRSYAHHFFDNRPASAESIAFYCGSRYVSICIMHIVDVGDVRNIPDVGHGVNVGCVDYP
jgi:hypothetical protein